MTDITAAEGREGRTREGASIPGNEGTREGGEHVQRKAKKEGRASQTRDRGRWEETIFTERGERRGEGLREGGGRNARVPRGEMGGREGRRALNSRRKCEDGRARRAGARMDGIRDAGREGGMADRSSSTTEFEEFGRESIDRFPRQRSFPKTEPRMGKPLPRELPTEHAFRKQASQRPSSSSECMRKRRTWGMMDCPRRMRRIN